MSVNRHPNTQGVTIKQWRYTATGGETTLSGTDGFSQSLTYTPGAEEVFVNGVLLVRGTDYTASTGTTVVLNNALVAGDIATVSAPSVFNVANTVPLATVTAKGDLIVGNGAASVTNLGVGADGSTLVANSSAGGGLSWTTPITLANPVINGGFDCWQRGTSISYAASTASYSSDRWYFGTPANGASTVARYSTNDTTLLPNIQYCARVQRNSGQTGTGYIGFDSSIETANSIPYSGKTITFSFYARAGANYSTASNNLYFQLVSGTGTDQSVTSGFTGATYPINTQAVLTTNWQRFTATGTIPSNSTQLGIRFLTNPTGTAGAADYFELTGVQIDLGTYTATTAPAFRRSGGTVQGELAAAQRYYWRSSGGQISGNHGLGLGTNSTQAYINVKLPVTMRTIPSAVDYSTVALFNGSSGFSATSVALNTGNSSCDTAFVTVTVASGITTSNAYILRNDGSSSGYIGFTAEL